MDKLESAITESKYVRWFLRSLTGVILIFYTYYIIFQKITTDDVPLNLKDWSIIIGSISVWATWEAVRKYLDNKLSK